MRISTLTFIAALGFATAAAAQEAAGVSAGVRTATPPDAALAGDNARAQQVANSASTSPGTAASDDHGYRGGNTINDSPERKVTPRGEQNKDVKTTARKAKKSPARRAPEAG